MTDVPELADRAPTGDRCSATTDGGAVGPCVLPLGHDETLHQAPDGKSWLPDVEVTITADVSGFENGVKDARIATLELAVAMLTKRAEQAERQRTDALALIRDLTDPDPCYFDHNGGCQAHGYLSLKPGEKCPHAEAKEMLGED